MTEMIERVREAIQHAERFGTDKARAAIEAMREPTEGMIRAAQNAQVEHHNPPQGASFVGATVMEVTKMCRAMIDAALK